MNEDRLRQLMTSLDRSLEPDELTVARLVRDHPQAPRSRMSIWTASLGVAAAAAVTLLLVGPIHPPVKDNDGIAMVDLGESALLPWEGAIETCDMGQLTADECLPEDHATGGARQR
ncbi:MAG: hypothetical protein ACI9MC_003916 [Kiritimatiellia bacterium]|jgi:hypothetical protein